MAHGSGLFQKSPVTDWDDATCGATGRHLSLKLLEIFVQGEEIVGERRLRVLPGTTVGEMRKLAALLRRKPTSDELWLFEENEIEPLAFAEVLKPKSGRVMHLHLHRCRHVTLTIHHLEDTHTLCVAPGTTFGQVLVEMETRGMVKDKQELTTCITGTKTHPDTNRHVGAFVYHPFCELVLNID